MSQQSWWVRGLTISTSPFSKAPTLSALCALLPKCKGRTILLGVQVGTASLNLLKGDKHLRLKKVLGDAFSEETVEALKPTLQECTKLYCKR